MDGSGVVNDEMIKSGAAEEPEAQANPQTC